jgi:hypothetical protein
MGQLRRSSLLFANPSLIEGVARTLDLGCTLNVYNESPTGEIADYLALTNDWYAVGDDFRAAIENAVTAQQQP